MNLLLQKSTLVCALIVSLDLVLQDASCCVECLQLLRPHGGTLVISMSTLFTALCQIFQVQLVILEQAFSINQILTMPSDFSCQSLHISLQRFNGIFILSHLPFCVSDQIVFSSLAQRFQLPESP